MKALLAILRPLSGSAVPSGPAISTGTHLIELTDTQLAEVAGGGGHFHYGDSGNSYDPPPAVAN